MARRIQALVNPTLLAWARKEAGYSIADVVEKLKLPAEKLRAWERESPGPTLRQAEKLAKLYHRPYSVFCMEAPPPTTPLAADYRRHPHIRPGAESPDLRLALRQMIYRREVALELLDELGDEPERFAVQIRLGENPETAANRLRERIGITHDQQLAWRDEFHAWREWRQAVEALGVLVFQFPKVDPEEVRGVSILDFPLPVIGVNSKEIPASKPFTLIHELVHLALASANEERPALNETRSAREWTEIEKYAEAIAAAVLMPQTRLLEDALVRGRSTWTVDDMRRLARRYKVTPLAMATRLLRTGRLAPASYNRWRGEWNQYLAEHPPKKPRVRVLPPARALGRNGYAFTILVLDALNTDRITGVQAARYLDLRFPHVETLRRDLIFRRATPAEAQMGE